MTSSLKTSLTRLLLHANRRLRYNWRMNKVTIAKRTYNRLKREAAAWRHVIGPSNDGVIFDAVRDNGGRGISAEKFARILEKLIWEDTKIGA